MHGAKEDSQKQTIYELLAGELAADAAGECILQQSANVRVLRIRATSATGTTRCSLATGERVTEHASAFWDIGFQRYRGATNGGTSGFGLGRACSTTQTSLDSVTSLSATAGAADPACPHLAIDTQLTGSSGGAGGATDVQFSGSPAFHDWYTYDIFDHVLKTRNYVYIVRSGDGNKLYKLQILDYYSNAGTSGFPLVRYAEVSP